VIHREVAVMLIVAIPLQGEIVGANRDAAQAKAAPAGWIEEVTKDMPPTISGKGLKRLPADLAETTAEALDRLVAAAGDNKLR
jgi:hypothetical protein